MASQLYLLLIGILVCLVRQCFTNNGSNATSKLLDKYSGADRVFTQDNLQQIFDRICNCSSPLDANITASPLDANITDTESVCTSDCNSTIEVRLSAMDVFQQLDVQDLEMNATMFEYACPMILEILESKACGRTASTAGTDIKTAVKKEISASVVWTVGLIAVTVISLSSVLGALMIPFMDKSFYNQLLTLLIGLAVGSLTASSLFHLIPQAFDLVDSKYHHLYLNRSMIMWIGIWAFFMIERLLKMLSDYRRRTRLENTVDFPRTETSEAVSSVSSPTELLPHLSQELEPLQNQDNSGQSISQEQTNNGSFFEYPAKAINASLSLQEKPKPHSPSHDHKIPLEDRKSAIATVAWMVIFGDGFHNFIDGLSIGAAFSESALTGISISVAVLCEELPHELGDFAVLLNSGMSLRQALMYNFLSACTCYAGLVFGIIIGEFQSGGIFGFAAGMFLYIALVDMVPEMNEVAEKASKFGIKSALFTLGLQNMGMWFGVTTLFMLAQYQDQISFG